jgi:hypothetical protein
MTIIRFADKETERRALEFIVTRFSGRSWATGEMMVPEEALAALDSEGIPYTVEGPATYEQLVPSVRNPSAAKV